MMTKFHLLKNILAFGKGTYGFCKEYKELTRIVFWDIEIFDEELKRMGPNYT